MIFLAELAFKSDRLLDGRSGRDPARVLAPLEDLPSRTCASHIHGTDRGMFSKTLHNVSSSSFPVFLNCSRESREVPEFIVPTLIEKNTNFFG